MNRVRYEDFSLGTHRKLSAWIAVAALASVAGCATPTHFDRGSMNLANGNFEVAYRFFENPAPNRRQDVERIIHSNPKLVEAGAETFSEAALAASIAKYGRSTAFYIESMRLDYFRQVATEDRYHAARDNLVKMFPAEIAAAAETESEKEKIAALPREDQSKYWDEKRQKERDDNSFFGVVINVQVTNESTVNNQAGANFGAALGQASYLDSTSWRGYSATSQLGAGLVGAMLGGMLDQPTKIQYRLTYFIKLANGDVKQFDILARNQSHIPAGVCVQYYPPAQIDIVNQNKCAGS